MSVSFGIELILYFSDSLSEKLIIPIENITKSIEVVKTNFFLLEIIKSIEKK